MLSKAKEKLKSKNKNQVTREKNLADQGYSRLRKDRFLLQVKRYFKSQGIM